MKIQLTKMRSFSLLSITLLTLLFLFTVVPVSAADTYEGGIVPCGGTGQADCQLCHFFIMIERIINLIFTRLVPMVASLMIIIGGFYLLISGPSPELFNQARAILTAAVIGIVIIFIAWLFLNQLLTAIGIKEWTGLVDNPQTQEKEGWWDFTDQCPIVK